jgi:hypothetical protein
LDVEAKRQQHAAEQKVLLEAVSAPTAIHELRDQDIQLEIDRPAEQYVDGLERDGLDVERMELFENPKASRARTPVSYPLKVAL